MNREEAYDAEVAPLMGQIIEICKKHDIPMLASFQLDDDREEHDKGDFFCTTFLPQKNPSENFVLAAQIIKEGFAALVARVVPK